MNKFDESVTINQAIRILVTQPITRDDRLRVLNRIWQVDIRSMSYRMLENIPQISDDTVYRVSVCPDGVDVVCF